MNNTDYIAIVVLIALALWLVKPALVILRWILAFFFIVILTNIALVSMASANTSITNEQIQKLGITTTHPIADDTEISTSLLGQVQIAPQAKLIISRPFSLQTLQWHVQLGQLVKKGQPLLTVYCPSLLELEHNYHQNLSKFKLAKQKLERESQLVKEGIISYKQFQTTEAEFTQDQENIDSSISQFARMGLSDSELEILKSNKHLEGKLTITASEDGKIASLDTTTGQSLAANMPMLSIHRSDDLIIETPMPPAQAASLSIGTILTLEDKTPITVTGFQPQVSDAQKTLVIGSTKHPILRAGQWIRVNLPTDANFIGWRIPRNALTYIDNQPHLLIKKTSTLTVEQTSHQTQALMAMPVTLVRATREGWVVQAAELTKDSYIVINGVAAAKGFIGAAE